MAKRKREPVALPELDSLELDEFTRKLKEDGGRDLVAKVALAIAHLGGLTATDLQTFSETVPAFSKARWDKVAPKFGLDISRDIYQLETFSVPCLSLPPSFHREVMRNSAQWLDVYQEAGSHSREAARVRLMDAVCCMRFLSTTWLNTSFSGMCLFALYSRVVLSIDQSTPCPIRRKLREAR
jgi:hypothetical protein